MYKPCVYQYREINNAGLDYFAPSKYDKLNAKEASGVVRRRHHFMTAKISPGR